MLFLQENSGVGIGGNGDKMIEGIATSGGIGIGRAYIIVQKAVKANIYAIKDVEAEKNRYKEVKTEFIKETELLIEQLKGRLKSNEKLAMVLKNQIYLINDCELNDRILDFIEKEHICAEAAVLNTCKLYAEIFSAMDNEVMNQRVADIEDLKNRLIKMLQGEKILDLSKLPPDTVIIAEELHPSITANIDIDNVAGIVAKHGGENSHAAILARAFGIPAVLSAKNIFDEVTDDDILVVDGNLGRVIVSPDAAVLKQYEVMRQECLDRRKGLGEFKGKPTKTKDKVVVRLAANVGNYSDIIRAKEQTAEGIGLFRTEFLFMDRVSMPTEEEQFEMYKAAVVSGIENNVTIRTLDIGGDKEISYMSQIKEENPFLGCRGIRYCLVNSDILKTQLRAVLRASRYGKIRIMLPMITTLEEITQVKKLIESIKQELDEKGTGYDKDIKLGIMIETPAAAVMSEVFAKEVDFFSIGTNDLIQYTMAADRGNENVAYLYSIFEPAVLRLIKNVIETAVRNNIDVCVCGESAANPEVIPLLLSFGLRSFSVSPSMVLETRKHISGWDLEAAGRVAENVMAMSKKDDIIKYIREEVKNGAGL